MTDPKPALVVRAPRDDEFDSWATMFRNYREFYRLVPDVTVVERVWSWIQDPEHETRALVAESGHGSLVGFAHFRRFARPSTGTTGIYLDDLLTEEGHRGEGIGRSLIEAVREIGRREGCSIVRWITAADNVPGQHLYDSVATKTSWVTYDKPCN